MIMVDVAHQEAIEQVILNLKAQVAGLNQQIEALSNLLEMKTEDVDIHDVPGQIKRAAAAVAGTDHLNMILVRGESYEMRERMIKEALDAQVHVTGVEQFIEDFQDGLRGGQVGTQKFKDTYDGYEVLVVENLEQLAGSKPKLQEQLFDRVYQRSEEGKLTILSGNAAFIIGTESEEYLHMLSLGKNVFVG